MRSPLNRLQLAFASPRNLPCPSQLTGRVVVLDVAFADTGSSGSFETVTLPFIQGLGDRLMGWIDHHDHSQTAKFLEDPRFVLSTKAEHPACPEMIDEALCARIGPVESVVCHTDLDGLASAAKWVLGGIAPYAECDMEARAIDTRLGKPSPVATTMDRALRARPCDTALYAAVVRYLATGLEDLGLWQTILKAARQLDPIENASRRAARQFERVAPDVAILDVSSVPDQLDTTLLLLPGQEVEPVSVVLDRNNTHVAAWFDSGYKFLELFGLPGGMPTHVAGPRSRAREVCSDSGSSRERRSAGLRRLELLTDGSGSGRADSIWIADSIWCAR